MIAGNNVSRTTRNISTGKNGSMLLKVSCMGMSGANEWMTKDIYANRRGDHT